MIIADSSYSMASAQASDKRSSSSESLRVWVDPPPNPNDSSATPSASQSTAASIVNAINQAQDDPKLQMLRTLLEGLFGCKFKIKKIHLALPTTENIPQSTPPATASAKVGWGVQYNKTDSYSESEKTAFEAKGTITTADGKDINFNVNMSMEYQYSTSSQTNINLGDAKKADPLVVNFGGGSAQLSDQRFAFELSPNSQNKDINFAANGSGFLVLDKNGNGVIDNGSEMFGPSTGNGFAELAAYDKTGKGWIDSSNPVYSQLKVLTKNADGSDNLASLASLGIGALSVKNISTPFDIKNPDSNSLKGSVVSTGVFIRNDGTAGSVQQVDLAV